jgi:hypothetical protein
MEFKLCGNISGPSKIAVQKIKNNKRLAVQKTAIIWGVSIIWILRRRNFCFSDKKTNKKINKKIKREVVPPQPPP